MKTRFMLKSDPADFSTVPAVLRSALPSGLLDRGGLARLQLALHELLVNISRHAYGNPSGAIEIEVEPGGSGVQVTVTDSGVPFRGEVSDDLPAQPSNGGYGLSIISRAADSVEYRRCGPVNRWTLMFRPRCART